ncbi:AfsR/SARP family transcriptional regulator [Flindersiella endophytica]
MSGLESEAARLEEQRISVLEECLHIELDLGAHAERVSELSGLVTAHPLHERLRGLQMLALYRSGRQADALECYRIARTPGRRARHRAGAAVAAAAPAHPQRRSRARPARRGSWPGAGRTRRHATSPTGRPTSARSPSATAAGSRRTSCGTTRTRRSATTAASRAWPSSSGGRPPFSAAPIPRRRSWRRRSATCGSPARGMCCTTSRSWAATTPAMWSL